MEKAIFIRSFCSVLNAKIEYVGVGAHDDPPWFVRIFGKKKKGEKKMYYRLPKKIFTDERFSALSAYAIITYCILMDRVGLSEKTGRVDKNGRPYIFFSRKELSRLLRVSERSAIRYIKELKKIGLVSFGNKAKGNSPPIYVKDILEKKKPVFWERQTKSYNDDEVHEALLKQFMKGL